jgi:hypothetical protein
MSKETLNRASYIENLDKYFQKVIDKLTKEEGKTLLTSEKANQIFKAKLSKALTTQSACKAFMVSNLYFAAARSPGKSFTLAIMSKRFHRSLRKNKAKDFESIKKFRNNWALSSVMRGV